MSKKIKLWPIAELDFLFYSSKRFTESLVVLFMLDLIMYSVRMGLHLLVVMFIKIPQPSKDSNHDKHVDIERS